MIEGETFKERTGNFFELDPVKLHNDRMCGGRTTHTRSFGMYSNTTKILPSQFAFGEFYTP